MIRDGQTTFTSSVLLNQYFEQMPNQPTTTPAPVNRTVYTGELRDELASLARAIRTPLADLSAPGTTAPGPEWDQGREAPPINHQAIAAAAIGDNILVSATGARLEIMELVVWNTAAATLIFQDGFSGPAAQRLLRLTAFPANSGYTLGYSGQPHMVVSPGNAFVLNLSAGDLVDGYVRYRSV